MADAPSILCATDLTHASARTRDLAVAFAKASGATIDLLFVYGDAGENWPEAIELKSAVAEAMKESRAQEAVLEQRLHSERDEVIAHGVACTALFSKGSPWRQVPECAKARGAMMIVIGAHGGKGAVHVERGGMRELVLGTTVDRVLRTADRPVFVATGEADIKEAFAATRWFVGYDYSPSADAALAFADNIVKRVKGTLHLGNVVIPAGGEGSTDEKRTWVQLLREQSKREAEEKLVAFAKERVPNATAHQVVSVNAPARALCDAAIVAQADVLVVGTHGTSALGRLLVGSTAEQCLRLATVPVALVPTR